MKMQQQLVLLMVAVTHLAVAHVAVDFGLGGQGGHGVDDDDVDGTGTDQVVGNLQGLLAVVGLRNEEVVDVNTQFLGVEAVEGVLGVDEGGNAAGFLAFGDGVDGQGGLTGTLGAIDFYDAAAGESSDAQGHVEADAAGGDDVELFVGAVAQLHNGALAVALLYLVEGALEDFQFFLLQGIGIVDFFCHNVQVFRLMIK